MEQVTTPDKHRVTEAQRSAMNMVEVAIWLVGVMDQTLVAAQETPPIATVL